eukprot:480853-Amphidinium_carterae.2
MQERAPQERGPTGICRACQHHRVAGLLSKRRVLCHADVQATAALSMCATTQRGTVPRRLGGAVAHFASSEVRTHRRCSILH